MRKKLLSACLSLVLILSFIPTIAHAASGEATAAANALYELGLFNGTGKDEKGNPIFDLDRTPTRYEAVTMLVRLLGKASEAESNTYNTPFTDVVAWARPYVGYAYANKLTSGTSGTTYGGAENITASQYLTFVLRALGYDSGIDFQWNKAWELSDKIGLTNGQYNTSTTNFTRGDVAFISYRVLSCKIKNSDQTLVRKLYDEGALSFLKIRDVGLGLASGLENIDTPSNLRLDTENGTHFLVWNAPAQNVSVYHVMVSEKIDGDYEIYLPQDGDRAYAPLNNSGLFEMKAGTTYYFKVSAYFHDDTRNIDNFSAYTEAIAFNYSELSQDENVPESVISELLLCLNRATSWEQSALLAAKLSYDTSSSTYGVYYAEQAQSVFEQTTDCLSKAVNLCSQYSNLEEVNNDLLYIFNLETQYVNTAITTSNYLDFAEQVILNSQSIIDKYENSVLIVGNLS